MKSLELAGYIKRGKNRHKIFMALDKPRMPSELVIKIYGKSSNTYFNIVSRALTELEQKNLVECINSKERTGRIYKLTKKGKETIKFL